MNKLVVVLVSFFHLLFASSLNNVSIQIVPPQIIIDQIISLQNKVRKKLDVLDVDFISMVPRSFSISLLDLPDVFTFDKDWFIREDQLKQQVSLALHRFHNLAVVNILDIDALDEFDLVKTENKHEYHVVLKVNAGGLLDFLRYELKTMLRNKGMKIKEISFYEPSIILGSATIKNDYVAEELRYVLMNIDVPDIKIETDTIQLAYHDINGMPVVTDVKIA